MALPYEKVDYERLKGLRSNERAVIFLEKTAKDVASRLENLEGLYLEIKAKLEAEDQRQNDTILELNQARKIFKEINTLIAMMDKLVAFGQQGFFSPGKEDFNSRFSSLDFSLRPTALQVRSENLAQSFNIPQESLTLVPAQAENMALKFITAADFNPVRFLEPYISQANDGAEASFDDNMIDGEFTEVDEDESSTEGAPPPEPPEKDETAFEKVTRELKEIVVEYRDKLINDLYQTGNLPELDADIANLINLFEKFDMGYEGLRLKANSSTDPDERIALHGILAGLKITHDRAEELLKLLKDKKLKLEQSNLESNPEIGDLIRELLELLSKDTQTFSRVEKVAKLEDLIGEIEKKIDELEQALDDHKKKKKIIVKFEDGDVENLEALLRKAKERLAEIRQQLDSDRGYQSREQTRENLIQFLGDIKTMPNPEREVGEELDKYLERVHKALMMRLLIYVSNGKYDNAGDKTRFANPDVDPLTGPVKKVDVLGDQLIYDPSTLNKVKTFESFLDQFLDLFPEDEKEVVKSFSGRVKDQMSQYQVLHNRGFARRSNEDKAGPDGAFKAINELYRDSSSSVYIERIFANYEHMTETEKRFTESVEFCCSVWSAMSLTMTERRRLWPNLSDEVKDFFEVRRVCTGKDIATGKYLFASEPVYVIKKKYDQLPRYRGAIEDQKALVTAITSKVELILAKLPNLSSDERIMLSEMAYNFGESYRVGCGMEAFYDATFYNEASDVDTKLDIFDPDTGLRALSKIKVNVKAQEGEPKGAAVGYYCESTNANKSRTRFNEVYAQNLGRLYLPLSRAIQYDVNFTDEDGNPVDIGGFNDGRASLAQILAVPGAIYKTDFKTSSKDPNKVVIDQATEAQFFWNNAELARAKKEPKGLMWNPSDIRLTTTRLLNEQDEVAALRTQFDLLKFDRRLLGARRNLMGKFNIVASLKDYEDYGFYAESKPLGGDREHLAGLIKHFRDYWIGGISVDIKTHPGDFFRSVEYLFGHDGRPESDYLVNERFATGFNHFKLAFSDDTISDSEKGALASDFKEWVNAYAWWDTQYFATVYMYAYDQELADIDISNPPQVYQDLTKQSLDTYKVTNNMGGLVPNTAIIEWMVNRAILIRDAFKDESGKFARAGYSMTGNIAMVNRDGVPFTRFDILKRLQEMHLAEGYEFQLKQTAAKTQEYRLVKVDPIIGLQDVLNRIDLLTFLYDDKTFQASVSGK